MRSNHVRRIPDDAKFIVQAGEVNAVDFFCRYQCAIDTRPVKGGAGISHQFYAKTQVTRHAGGG